MPWMNIRRLPGAGHMATMRMLLAVPWMIPSNLFPGLQLIRSIEQEEKNLMMPRPAEEFEREYRIRDEAIVDAHGPEEQAMGWYYYLADRLSFPFEGECQTAKRTSPLRPGEKVEVLAMAREEECEREMFVMVTWRDAELAVPLSQVAPVNADEDTIEAVGDWHYWLKRNYEF